MSEKAAGTKTPPKIKARRPKRPCSGKIRTESGFLMDCVQDPEGHGSPHRKLLRAGPLGKSRFIQFRWNGKGTIDLAEFIHAEKERRKKRQSA